MIDAALLERLRSELTGLGLPPQEIEHQIALAVADFARPTTDIDRATVELQRRDVFTQ